ncbi:hypothetical protein Lal_00016591 [Lupinus albus]|uniref:Putative arabinogalactan peptide, AGP n=1 Tax=Lupinus albus TaxID=3870 RepID=A0A6A5MDR0_LUPAL|nr:putative arabinogalactan peptide, AGP [Lupinus albus]KAF1872754.1 hypothetical protein Lal_00016591 [Lupinus albus]
MDALRLVYFSILSLVLFAISDIGQAHEFASSPSPAHAPSSDGSAVDQGIAYFLMLVALAITYMFH